VPIGTVTSFDEYVGLGEVHADSGETYRFHCVEIADSTRTIEIGAAVAFDVIVKFGQQEAAQLRQVT